MGGLFSSQNNLEWVQVMIEQLTPWMRLFASEVLTCQIEPLIRTALKNSEAQNLDFKFEKIDFGDSPPKVSRIRTHRTTEAMAKSVIVDFDMEYAGNSDLQVSLMGIHTGVRDLKVSGRVRLTFKPTIQRPPFVGGIQFCFLDTPKIDFDLEGLADICDWSPIKNKILREVEKDAAKKCAHPNFFAFTMSDTVDKRKVKAFNPLYVLSIRLDRAAGLPTKTGLRSLVGQDKPDAYAKIRLGAETFESNVVKNDENPEWSQQKFDFMLDTIKGHRLKIDLFDKDSLSTDDFLGRVEVDTDDLADNEETTLGLDDEAENEIRPSLTFTPTIRALLPCFNVDNPTFFVANIFVYSCNNLAPSGDDLYPTTRLLVSLDDEVLDGDEIKSNNPHPDFEENFVFTRKDAIDGTISIRVMDQESGLPIGGIELDSEVLKQNAINRKIIQMKKDDDGGNTMTTITLSANIHAC